VFRRLFFVGAAEYFESPFMRRFARATNIVPVDANTNLMRAMQAGAAGLRLGKVLVLFPEGERSIDGELKPFRKGAAVLSTYLSAPIVPVAIDGFWERWPRGHGLRWATLVPRAARPVRVAIGAPIAPVPGDDAATGAALRAAVERLLAEIRADQR
jgi:long-chain acyl-CoA synthetase